MRQSRRASRSAGARRVFGRDNQMPPRCNDSVLPLPRAVEDLRSTLEGLEGGAELWTLPEDGLAMLENIEPTTRLRHLYRYMRETGTLVTVEAS